MVSTCSNMNSNHAQHQFPPPPPPPPPPAGPPAASGPQRAAQRRPEVPTISTALSAAQRFGSHLQTGTPGSAASSYAPASPRLGVSSFAAQPSSPMATARVPSSISTAYNPQEWRRGGVVSGSYMPHAARSGPQRTTSTRDATGMEAMMPSPPPPYSPSPQSAQLPPRGMFPSPNMSSFTSSPTNYFSDNATPISAATSVSSGGFPSSQRIASIEQAQTHPTQSSPTPFPAPPSNTRDRSGSRSRFNLSALASRHRSHASHSGNNAMENLQLQTSYSLAQYASPTPQHCPVSVVPPAARRAASTGAITNSPSPFAPESSNMPATNTPELAQHGFALPPPPPGPPPGGRSQSLNRVPDRSPRIGSGVPGAPASTNSRAAAIRSSQLGPIPPTPAGWTDDGSRNQTRSTTPSQRNHSERRPQPSQDRRYTANGDYQPDAGQSEAPAAIPREASVIRGIRERRSESRVSREPSRSRDAPSDHVQNPRPSEAKPADLVLQPSGSGALSRRRHVSKAKISPLLDGRSSPAAQRQRTNSDDMSSSQPGSASLPHGPLSGGPATQPLTPFPADKTSNSLHESPLSKTQGKASPHVSEKSTPIVDTGRIRVDSSSGVKQRPVSHILHTPIEEKSVIPPLVPSRPSFSQGPSSTRGDSELPEFAREAVTRHASFVQAESKARSDEERLQLFADFIVHESRVRRDRYADAFDALGSEVLDMTRDMWRSFNAGKRQKQSLPSVDASQTDVQSIQPPPSSGSDMCAEPTSTTSMSSQSDSVTPISVPDSPASIPSQQRARASSRNLFQPMLSPIQSMAMSTIIDDSVSTSRGRTASRWWETSTDANSIGGGRRLERSHKETKYMGLPREAREHLQWESIPEDSPGPGPSQPGYIYGENEYPAEKVGWHNASHSEYGRQITPPPRGMDISRLVTLPPPYPRHYPAVNNKHPDLGPSRSVLRTLNARDEVARIREEYEAGSGGELLQPERTEEIASRRKQFRRSVQEKVANGSMSFAEAAQAEADFDASEAKHGRDQAQKAFSHFQSEMVAPLNQIFQDGIHKATSCMDQISDSLSYEAQSHNPNQTQEEGDEQPELLEKLTLIKWFHEAREHLYTEMFNLEGESDERYKTVILLPYRQAGNEDKVHEVESFFDRDSRERRVKLGKQTLQRFEELLRTTEKHVTRGAEVQLSAFWDIAPELLAVIQRVPNRLRTFDIQIPSHELEENPNYGEHPMQYLYTLLSHSDKSAYQFIEGQINLLCLLHEVKSAVMNASCRLMETQRMMEGEEKEVVKHEMKEIREEEDLTLTSDLKERVSVIEEQWRQALGKGLEECKERVRAYLFESGGWDESLDE